MDASAQGKSCDWAIPDSLLSPVFSAPRLRYDPKFDNFACDDVHDKSRSSSRSTSNDDSTPDHDSKLGDNSMLDDFGFMFGHSSALDDSIFTFDDSTSRINGFTFEDKSTTNASSFTCEDSAASRYIGFTLNSKHPPRTNLTFDDNIAAVASPATESTDLSLATLSIPAFIPQFALRSNFPFSTTTTKLHRPRNEKTKKNASADLTRTDDSGNEHTAAAKRPRKNNAPSQSKSKHLQHQSLPPPREVTVKKQPSSAARSRENNRLAAAKFRAKKKKRTDYVASTLEEASKRNEVLKMDLRELRDEFTRLRLLALEHQGCCHQIATYHVCQAGRVAQQWII